MHDNVSFKFASLFLLHRTVSSNQSYKLDKIGRILGGRGGGLRVIVLPPERKTIRLYLTNRMKENITPKNLYAIANFWNSPRSFIIQILELTTESNLLQLYYCHKINLLKLQQFILYLLLFLLFLYPFSGKQHNIYWIGCSSVGRLY